MSYEALETELTGLKGKVFDLEQEKGQITEPWRADYKGKNPARLAEIQKELERLGKKESELEKVVDLRKMLRIHEKNLSRLEEKAAVHGTDAPISVLNQVDHEKDRIAEIKAQLETLGA
jgi:hypothetical protein